MIFDTHAHYDDEAFQEDRKELLSGLLEQGIGNVVNAGAAARELPRILRLTEQYDFLFGAAGIHPCETYCSGDNVGQPVMHLTDLEGNAFSDLWDAAAVREPVQKALRRYDPAERITQEWHAGEREMELLQALAEDPKMVAIGEIGLDYHYEDTQKSVQQEWFTAQIALAQEKGLPIIVHSRDAAADTLDLIRAHARDVGGIIHCFSYSREMAVQYVDMGYMIGIGGVVTYKNAKKIKEVAAYLPLEHLVLETDCPYLAPTPFRGKRNDSSLIPYVVQEIAAIKGIPEEEIVAVTEANARRVFQLK